MQAGAVWLKTMRELWHEQARRNHTSTAHQHSSKAQHQQYRNLQQSAGQQYSAAAKRTVVADARQQAGVVADDDHAALKLLQSVGQRVDGLQSGGREGRHGGGQAGRQAEGQAGRHIGGWPAGRWARREELRAGARSWQGQGPTSLTRPLPCYPITHQPAHQPTHTPACPSEWWAHPAAGCGGC